MSTENTPRVGIPRAPATDTGHDEDQEQHMQVFADMVRAVRQRDDARRDRDDARRERDAALRELAEVRRKLERREADLRSIAHLAGGNSKDPSSTRGGVQDDQFHPLAKALRRGVPVDPERSGWDRVASNLMAGGVRIGGPSNDQVRRLAGALRRRIPADPERSGWDQVASNLMAEGVFVEVASGDTR